MASKSPEKNESGIHAQTATNENHINLQVQRLEGQINRYRESEESVKDTLTRLAIEYGIPDWFLFTIAHRESTFNNTLINYNDGISCNENWNSPSENYLTDDGCPHGIGVVQLTGGQYGGIPRPFNLPENYSEEDLNKVLDNYNYSMGNHRNQDRSELGLPLRAGWIDINNVSLMTDPFDVEQNVRRFITGFALPLFKEIQRLHEKKYPFKYKIESDIDMWAMVAFHWHYGLFTTYDPTDKSQRDYMEQYRQLRHMYYPDE